jgi:type IV pilus assembly protein PilY1
MKMKSLIIVLTALLLSTMALLAHAITPSNSPISNEPLGTGTGVNVQPNIYFVFDDSGSMSWDYLPDYVSSSGSVNYKYCLGNSLSSPGLANLSSSSGNLSGSGTNQCNFSDPPYNAPSFNYVAYDPNISYLPATDYDGTNTVYVSMNSANTAGWTVVPEDKFGVLSTSVTNLVTGFPDNKWCNGSSTSDCRTNALGYKYPDLVKYTTPVSNPGPAYYYTMSPAYYCTDYTGTSCQSTSDSTHTQPFDYLWCASYTASAPTSGTTTTPGFYTNCQSLHDNTHAIPTFLGNTITATAAKATGGSITVSSASSYAGYQVVGITVAGIQLISSTVAGTSSDTAHSLAVSLCSAIHANTTTTGFDCPATYSASPLAGVSSTGSTAYLTANANGAANNGAVVVQGPSSTHIYTPAVGSFRVNTPVNTTMKTNSIMVASSAGSTQLLAAGTIVTATSSQNTTAAALCTAINTNTSVSHYQARVVSSLGAASPAWGSGTACTSVTGSYVEIQSLTNASTENGKTISVTGPAATSATATISIAGNRFASGTRPGNLGTITATGPITLFNSIATSATTVVPNSNSQGSIDTGLRNKWASPAGFSISGTTGSIIINAPAGSTYNGTTVTVNTGTAIVPTSNSVTITFTATKKNVNLTGLMCGATNIIPASATNYSTGSSNTSSTWPVALATAINGNGSGTGSSKWGVSCPSGGATCTITAPTGATTPTCTVTVKSTTDSSISISSSGTFSSSTTVGNDNLLNAITTPITFSNLGSDGPIPVIGNTALSGFTDTAIGSLATTTTPFTGGADLKQRTNVGNFTRVDIINDGRTFAKGVDRTDCAGTVCTYAEEMTNFANWYAYYGTRCDMMKTGVFRTFAPIPLDERRPRVGFNDIYDSDHLDIADFTLANRQLWFATLKAKTCAVGGTPLQKGLSAAGRYYAGKIHTTSDPIQYSCQKNFTILSTDGYWNNNITNTPVDANGSTIGDVDSTSGINNVNTLPNKPKAAYYDSNKTAGTLADVAKWYYDHDLRNGPDSINDAAHGLGTVPTVAQNHYSNVDIHPTDSDPAVWQHMVTFTMGLGMDGLLHYTQDYLTGGSADYLALIAGTKSWGVPGANKQENVDDLWHAAVNGHGQYFSARNPKQVVSSLSTALTSISGMTGAASASATSNMEPVAGDNYLYAASYKTQDWTGDLEARTISVASSTAGQVSSTTIWSAQAILDSRDQAASPRTIYTYNSAGTGANGKAKLLTWSNLGSTEKSYFDITQLSNYVAGGSLAINAGCNASTSGNSPTQCQALLDYLTGASTGGAAAFRTRLHLLGDIVDTQPVFVGAPAFKYTDTGYSSFNPVRNKIVYVSVNDGMVHAFDGKGYLSDGVTVAPTAGSEQWAYVPGFTLPKLFNLADSAYPTNHAFLVDGPLTAGDVHINGQWSTVLIGGLGKGGNGYFALDVTDPTTPIVLWEFTDSKMGYTYGNPVITKLADGTWVAIVTSGYDNVPVANGGNAPSGDGQGHIYVINIASGALMFRIDTGDGSVSDPSNLGKITSWVSNSIEDNTALYLYGGDMHGNLWRVIMPTTTPASGTVISGAPSILKLFTAPAGQMITVKPDIGSLDTLAPDDHRMIYFGTGRFLSTDDKTDTTVQSIYGFYDDTLVTSSTPVPVKADLVQQTLCGQGLATQPAACSALASIPTTYRTTTQNAVPLGIGTGQTRGWYVDLPDVSVGSERVNIDPILQLGTLTVSSNVPTSSDCNAGGYSWIYYLDYKTGSFIQTTDTATLGLAGKKLSNALAVGQSVVKIGDKVFVLVTTSDKQYPVDTVRTSDAGGATKRVGWHELITE